jgi:hypothetical protein
LVRYLYVEISNDLAKRIREYLASDGKSKKAFVTEAIEDKLSRDRVN